MNDTIIPNQEHILTWELNKVEAENAKLKEELESKMQELEKMKYDKEQLEAKFQQRRYEAKKSQTVITRENADVHERNQHIRQLEMRVNDVNLENEVLRA